MFRTFPLAHLHLLLISTGIRKQLQKYNSNNCAYVIYVHMLFAFRTAHTPDNTFLGFVVQPHLSAKENERLQSISRKKQALVYGKRAEFWQVLIVAAPKILTY